ncbi:hypothetical protein GFY24_33285 [Nocardia sp. SYP-A9097]|uniref:protease inhibitor I42 family protein n=1 Tax=Nocardia sp. SYP-A9097 TaxID=2663237 RepID=UPI00129BFDA6|nr:protease inhibitor I42 family protein [Nocardia sp. SYP-A9097]MRH92254.1 hypothetical protein [Nocardia sp. SYP-A9097]
MVRMTLTATVGEVFEIDLKSTPTTGYRWQPTDLPAGIELTESTFTPIPDAEPGDGGTQHFRLRGTTRGHYTIEFRLERSWNNEAVDTHTTDIDIT